MDNKDKLMIGAMAGLLSLSVSSTDVFAEHHGAEKVKKQSFFSKIFNLGSDKKPDAKDACGGRDGCGSEEGHSKDACGGRDGCGSKDH